jgi:cob(I)alamin adenosyltransferase
MKIYTRTGDDGTTSLLGGKRVPKFHNRVEAYGAVDELISWIGLLKDYPENSSREEILSYIQKQLMFCVTVLATDPELKKTDEYLPEAGSIAKLEKEIDDMDKMLNPLEGFILPGGNVLVSCCHIARCVCRRAERAVLRLNQAEKTPDIIYKFLNRLADYLFVLSRKLCLELDIKEVKW